MIALAENDSIKFIGSYKVVNKALREYGLALQLSDEVKDAVIVNENVTLYPFVNTPPPAPSSEAVYVDYDGHTITNGVVVPSYKEVNYTPEQLAATAIAAEAAKKAAAKAKRKDAEANARVNVNGKKIKIDDNTVVMLSSYISSETESVLWKCDNDEWLNLSLDDMKVIMREIAKIKKELFENEYTEV